jgi:hypothetical protein
MDRLRRLALDWEASILRGISLDTIGATVVKADIVTPVLPRSDIVFRPAWRVVADGIRRDAMDYWLRNHLVQSDFLEERAKQLCAVVYVGVEMAGLSTVESFDWAGLKLFHYRCSVAPEFRQREITWRLTAFSHQLLEKWSENNPGEGHSGFLVTLEAPQFIGHMGLPIIHKHGLDLVFIGRNARGHQLRVMWFKHANVETDLMHTPS